MNLRLLQINTTPGRSAAGGIPEAIGAMAPAHGFEPWLGAGRHICSSASGIIEIGSRLDVAAHVAATRLLDRHGLHSRRATEAFIRRAEALDPAVVHIHNIHGYYLHYPTLFRWLRSAGRPVVWTLHDTWAITGHCAFFTVAGCDGWRHGCGHCPMKRAYPASWLADRSARNLQQKRAAFSGVPNLTIVAVGQWMQQIVNQSFLNDYHNVLIPNGIDTNLFRPCAPKSPQPLVLGVANNWDSRKGLEAFCRLRTLLPPDWKIRLIGLEPKQIRLLPPGIEGLPRIPAAELARHYSEATVLATPTAGEANNLTKMEALACGTPVATYRVGGAAEDLTADVSVVVAENTPEALAEGILRAVALSPEACRAAALDRFSAEANLSRYFSLYRSLL